MNLAIQLEGTRDRCLTQTERARHCCALAKNLEKAGEYEAACEAVLEFWPERADPPIVEGLDRETTAHLLLRVGALAGWLGSARQAEGSQEIAKNLITQSIEIFEETRRSQGVAEAHSDLALCYWREGAFDEARVHLAEALGRITIENTDLKACVLIRAGLVEVTAGRWNEALRFYERSEPLVDESADLALKGTFHNSFGSILGRLAGADNREDYLDRALIEYAAASFHFEQVGNTRYCALVENNLGFLFSTIGKFTEAHTHIDRARDLFLGLGDSGHVAQVNDTRARALLAEGRIVEAERYARAAVKTLENGDECSLLVEALTTHGTTLARLGNYRRSRGRLERAIEVAQTCGDLEGAGRANLSIIEELREQTPARELAAIYESAVDFLEQSQDPSAKKRLISCARAVIAALTTAEDDHDSEAKAHSWDDFSFRQEVVRIERALIERALRDTGGSVTRAARLLGFKHHQSLIALINTRHKNLLNTRSAVRKRRRHIFSEPRKIGDTVRGKHRDKSQIAILHVEDNEAVKKLVQDILTVEGMHVDSCVTGTTGLELLKRHTRYDLLIVDNELPGLSGLELVLRAKSIAHRRNTPIIMLSGDDIEKEAWRAGVKAFLRKPEDIEKISSTITRLLEQSKDLSD
jgi:two-component system phosphate regulon response regulator PhoB